MLNSIPFSVLMGLFFGFLSGLGIGGGTLLMMWLTLVVGYDHITARSVILMFFLAAAGSVCIFRLKDKTLSLKPILPAIVAASAAAAIFSWVSTKIDTVVLQKCFGILLLFTGVKELLYRERNAK